MKTFNLRFLSRWIAPIGLPLTLIACGSGDHPAATTSLKAIHASSDTGAVDIRVNNAIAVSGATFKQASGFLSIPAGQTRVQVNAAGSATSAIDATVPLAANRDTTVLAIGNSAAAPGSPSALRALVIDDAGNTPAAGNVKLRVVHAAPAVPAVDIFVTAPTAALPSTATIPALAYATAAPASGSNALEVPGGSYRVRARAVGSTDIAFDSGPITLPANGDLLIAAIPNTTTASPISLLVAPKGAAVFEILDQRARVRVGHFSPDTPAVDAFLSAPGATLSAANRVATSATFPVATNYQGVEPASYVASAALAGTTSAVITLPATLNARDSVSVFAVGLLNGAGAQALQLTAFVDDLLPPAAGQAKVRVLHLAPDAPAVDLVTVGAGGAISTVAAATNNLTFPNASGGYLSLPAGAVTVAVVPTGTNTPVLPTAAGVTLNLVAGRTYTVAATGCLTPANCGGNAFAFTVLTDR
jgi:Domain of unknown function (DUF4397)